MASPKSANYQSSSWDYCALQELLKDLSAYANLTISQELMEKVRKQTYGQMSPIRQLEFIEAVDRLGLDYLFQADIHEILSCFSRDGFKEVIRCGLRATSICFRLLRRFGFQVSENIFNDFLDEKKTLKASHSEDVFGLLSLYQASYMAFDDEHSLEAAGSFACTQLSEKKASYSPHQRALISHAMNLPLHWRMPWLEARTFIDLYELQDGMSPELLLLAKRHFNAIQNIHQKELSKVISWWVSLDIQRTISFSRDRVIECFFYAVGIVHHPEYGICRELLTKVGMLVVTIDDVYDLYGSLEELELFTRVFDRWPDVHGIKELPDYMKTCFSALIDTINEVVRLLSPADSLVAMPYIHKVVEQERGGTPTSIQCYINEMGALEEEARQHISILVGKAWKQLNRECSFDLQFPQSFIDASINLARMASCIYQQGDGFSAPNHEIKASIKSLFLNKKI